MPHSLRSIALLLAAGLIASPVLAADAPEKSSSQTKVQAEDVAANNLHSVSSDRNISVVTLHSLFPDSFDEKGALIFNHVD